MKGNVDGGDSDAAPAFDGDALLDATPHLYAVTGTVDGLEGASVTLLDNGAGPIVVSNDRAFAFPRELADGAA